MKVCVWCGVEYVDATKRKVGRTCSKKCAYEFAVATRRANGSYVRTDEANAKASATLKAQYASGERVCVVTSEHLEKMHNALRGPKPNHWTKTPEAKERLRQTHLGKPKSDEHRAAMSRGQQKRIRTKRETLHTSACGGYREDLGMYFRSRWEANFARVLNQQGKEWSYEAETFRLASAVSYTPDFVCDGTYYELKGRWYKGQAEKVAMFREQHPELPLVVIEEAEYRELSKRWKIVIPEWEGK